MQSYKVIGVMSGTSLDGLDIACCIFNKSERAWSYKIAEADTIPYNDEILKMLISASKTSAMELIKINNLYGQYIGGEVFKFLKKYKLEVDIISSHGHTIFHQPAEGYTFQLGSGANIASETGTTTICDFRSLDVSNGGQGAPLVPVGDNLLFGDYEFCLNLGGFSNISFKEDNRRVAFDICPVNIIINKFAEQVGMQYDEDGKIARKGNIQTELLNKLNDLSFYKTNYPKSLGREWLEEEFIPVIQKYKYSLEDKLRTIYEHIAIQITVAMNKKSTGKVLVTGGGTFNAFLIELISQKTQHNIIIPDIKLVKYKEAMIFAFLGVLRYRNEVNCYSSVTGANCDSCTGVIHNMIKF